MRSVVSVFLLHFSPRVFTCVYSSVNAENGEEGKVKM